MSQFQNTQPSEVSPEDQVAIVGYALALQLPEFALESRDKVVSEQVQAIRSCVRDAGISLSRLRQRNTAMIVGVNRRGQEHAEPFMIAPMISRELGLTQPGMTVEFGDVSGLAAVHAARSSLLNDGHRLAVVAEASQSESGVISLNIMLLQKLNEAMQDGHQVHGLVKGTALGYQVPSETLLNECCSRADLNRSQVLKIETLPESGLSAVLQWIAMGEAEPTEAHNDLDTAGFSSHSKTNGTRVTLLLQAPLINSQVIEDDAFTRPLSLDELAMSEGAFCELFQVPQTHTPMPWTSGLLDSGACSYGLRPNLPGYTQLNLQWHSANTDMPAFLSLQQGEV